MTNRKGDWAQTYTGKQFWPLDPLAKEVDLRDIAHSLGYQCRFNGHSLQFYSVAQHSVLVSRLVSREQSLAALFHDAAEAYTGYLIRPLKKFLPKEFKQMESQIESVIYDAFKIKNVNEEEIKLADNIALITEMRDVMAKPPVKWNEEGLYKPHSERIIPLGPDEAGQLFIKRYNELRKK